MAVYRLDRGNVLTEGKTVGDGFKADIASLRKGGGDFDTIGKDYQSLVDKLQTALTSLEGQDTPPWGDDDLGGKFGVVYEGLRDGMYESMGHLATKLQDIGSGLNNMAENHEADESFNDSMMKQRTAFALADSRVLGQFKRPDVASAAADSPVLGQSQGPHGAGAAADSPVLGQLKSPNADSPVLGQSQGPHGAGAAADSPVLGQLKSPNADSPVLGQPQGPHSPGAVADSPVLGQPQGPHSPGAVADSPVLGQPQGPHRANAEADSPVLGQLKNPNA
ncbi:hypothetical protein ACFXO2_02230 [Streptomyces sp. NPDC059152]|uniref:hypothetical protein n=1 Tax=Streptomyces sp. NPDC059152 TaxID=3346742 RepID=UPI00368A4432